MSEKKIAVVEVGGNSLINDKNWKTIPDQYEAATESLMQITDRIEAGWDGYSHHSS